MRITISKKIICSISALLLVAVVMGGYSTYVNNKSLTKSNQIKNVFVPTNKYNAEVIEETAASFTRVVEGVSEATEQTRNVAGTFKEQGHTAISVGDKTQVVASGVEESNAAVSEVTVTVSHLQERAEKLKATVSKFKV